VGPEQVGGTCGEMAKGVGGRVRNRVGLTYNGSGGCS
jgi:hypothetical protein